MLDLIVFRARRGFVSWRGVFSALFVVLFSAALLCFPTMAQDADDGGAAEPAVVAKDYIVLDMDASLKSSASKVSQALRRGFGAGDAAQFDKVCDTYILPMWTQPENRHKLAEFRQKFKSQLQNAKVASTRTHFNNHLLDKLPKMASGNYHPAVRYNCMLLLGDLDLSPPAGFGKMATPLPAALPLLLEALADGKQIDAVKVAALAGIARHSHLLRDNDARRQVADAMLALASTKSTPGTSSAGQAWMRGMAIDTLGNLKSAGEQNATLKALLEIVDDAEAPLSVRCAAARAIGKLVIGKPDGLDPGATVRQLGRVAMAACNTELAQCKEKGRTVSPRTLKSRLLAVRMGLMGTTDLRVEEPVGGAMRLLKKAEEKKYATAIREQIDRWLGLLDDERLTPKLEPEQKPGARGGMGGPGMGMEMGMGMGRPGMGMGGRGRGAGMPEEEDEMKVASDEIIEKITADLKSFAVLVQ